MALFQSDDTSPYPANIDHSMREVLDATQALGARPIETLSPQEARQEPLPGDGAKLVMRDRGIDPDSDLGVTTRDFSIAGETGTIAARVYNEEEAGSDAPLVVYWHGGGFVIADLDKYDATPRSIAKASGCVVISCHYRQGPEHKFPAAHDDAFAAYRWIVDNAASFGADANRIALMGESAGGNLALNVAIAARDQDAMRPESLVLVYPVASNDMNSESYREHEFAKPLSKALIQWMVGHYLNDMSEAADPRINLVDANLYGLPQTTIINAEIDPLRSDGELLAERLKAAGVEVSHSCYEGVTHEFFGMGLVVKDAAVAQSQAALAIKRDLRVGLLGKLTAAFN